MTTAHGGFCQLCNGYSQLLTHYDNLDVCPVCWQEQLQEREPEYMVSLLDLARHKVDEVANG